LLVSEIYVYSSHVLLYIVYLTTPSFELKYILKILLATVWKATNNGVVRVLFYAALYLQPKGSELYGGVL
jgi:hypothetical protein